MESSQSNSPITIGPDTFKDAHFDVNIKAENDGPRPTDPDVSQETPTAPTGIQLEPKNPQSSGDLVVKDPETGKFLPGHVKLGGRTAGKKNFTTKVQAAMERIADGQATSYEELIVKRIMLKAAQGDVNMIKHLWDHLDGRPTQKINLKGTVNHAEIPDDKVQEVIARIDAELEAALIEEPNV